MRREMSQYLDYYSDKTTILRYATLSIAFILVVLLGFGARFYLSTTFDASDFWGDLGLSLALCVYCMFIGIPEAKDNYRKKIDGRYQQSMRNFQEARSAAAPYDDGFDDWLEKYYEEQRTDYFRQLLTVAGVNNYRVLDLDLSEIPELEKGYRKIWENGTVTDFRTYAPEQTKVIKDILTGKYKVKKIPNDSFKSSNGRIAANEYVTQSRQDARNAVTYATLMASRLALMILISLILALFGIKLASSSSAEQVMNQIIDTIGRIWTMVSSYMYGFSIGRLMISNECVRLDFKARVNMRYATERRKNEGLSEEPVFRQIQERGADSEDIADGGDADSPRRVLLGEAL